ncbi:glycosyltransferase [Streptomyces sp. P38-E01]|uniref:Glycosyltransferase n=1 Tax=Streptomyces tardus TaxID=2780544 RepID=A0A949N8K1_9ACTN|nr:glycosyltransferase [Streptomyces tardus]MBU7598008.1 glycosyltransferase [Streptomyces tardus]
MSRHLFVVPPLTGHINPLRGVADRLAADGHQVAWAGHVPLLRELLGPQAQLYDCAGPGDLTRPPDLLGPAAFRFLWEEFFVPLADAMAPGVAAAVEAFAPQVVVSDQHAVAGALVAERHGLPLFTSSTTSAELIDPLSSMPKVAAWLGDMLDGLRERHGDTRAHHDPRFSPHGVIAFTTAAFLGPDVEMPHERVHLVGPAIAPRASDADFPWEWLEEDGRRTVLVSLGTANDDAGSRFLHEAVTALESLAARVRGIVVDPAGVLPSELPENVLALPRVPQLPLLERLDAVVCHGGHNTVCESLWHGVPLVVAPIRDDQPIVAGLVTGAGAGVRVRFTRVDAARLAKSIDAVLDASGGHAAAAHRIGETFRAAGGVRRAAGILAEAAR